MLLLVGLGNPGPRYAGNRHNIGFMALDELVRRHGFSAWRKGFQGEVADGRLGGHKVLALKPMTYMNESGRAVGEALRFYKLAPAEVVVFHDELDLAPGKVRVKLGGGAAGHNGLRSIAQHIGPDFKRVRLGIGHPGRKAAVHGWVLSDFAKAEAEGLDRLLQALARHAELLAGGEDGLFMSRVNQEVSPPKPKAPPKEGGKDQGRTRDPARGGAAPSSDEAPSDRRVPAAREAADGAGRGGSGGADDNKDEGPLAQALKRALGQFGGKTRK